MNCSVCGTPLAPDTLYCPRCGAPTAAYYASTGSSPDAQTVASAPPPPYGGAAPYTDYGAQPYGTAPSPSSTNPYDPYTPAPPPPTVADPSSYVPPPPTSYGPYAPLPPVPPVPPAQRPGNRFPLLIGGVILALLLIIGGVGFALLRGGGGSGPSGLSSAQMTATAQVQGTATATSSLSATATAQVQATATVIAANPDPYSPGGGQLALYDPLSDNSKGYDWDTGTTSNGTCGFSGGAYHVSPAKIDFFYLCAANASNYSNFAFEVQMNIIKGDCGGIVFRGDTTNGKFYLFRICQDGSYSLYMYPDFSGTTSKELAGGSSSAIKTGLNQSQVIAVVAQGSTLTVYINKQEVKSATDTMFSQGQIGVIAYSSVNPTEVVFSNAKVWKL